MADGGHYVKNVYKIEVAYWTEMLYRNAIKMAGAGDFVKKIA